MGHKKSLKHNLLIALLAGSAALYTMPIYAATSVIANNALPSGGVSLTGNHDIKHATGSLNMDIIQTGQNGVIKWDSFDVGGSATVNFNGNINGYHTLNYVNGGNVSQIYGTINAYNNGNIYIVNPAGVQIGNSAQINVGSLYVSNAKLTDDILTGVNDTTDFANLMQQAQGTRTDAELMSLGNINATNVTFEGDGRIVIDSERIKDKDGNNKLTAGNIFVNTTNKDNVIIGYDAYDEEDKTYANISEGNLVTLNKEGNYITKADGYMWVEDVDQLQAINTNLNGNYALRNSIDATATSSWDDNDNDNINEGFKQIGTANDEFTGKFDGIDYNIFGLTINRSDENSVGLFGAVKEATINNVTLVGGSITGRTSVGAIVGSANDSVISNSINSTTVNGDYNIGGIVGSATATTVENTINTGAVSGSANNVGGLIGSMTDNDTSDEYKSQLIGNSYNLGNVAGEGNNVGGLVGHAYNSTIGDGINLVYNRLDVTGLYNVGGIVGNMEGSTVQNAENSATVTATGYYTDKYTYHTADDTADATDGENENNIAKVDVNVANVGGIAGTSSGTSTIKDVTNSGDVSSAESTYTQYGSDHTYYTAGNVGGIVGSAVDTNITNATNQENDIRGAHNVGGVAGYFGGSGTVDKGINNGGDIMATGARDDMGFVTETVRPVSGNETFIIGNIGGIVGYLDGDNVKVTGSANRGTVHSQDIDDPDNVLDTSKAANVGGVVGKIDTSGNNGDELDKLLDAFRDGTYTNASVSNSYNTGDVRGYTGVGGVIGMMYNGSVAGSYNTGTVNTTRQIKYRTGGDNIDPLNMGGVVGDTTEQTDANAIIYDVYNKGQIGDETYNFYARHVGGVVGRLSGTLEKAYNNGDIYNNDTTVGGVVGWWYKGDIKNVFNTGNITVRAATELQVGGIVGASGANAHNLTNAYNLGTIRGYQESTSSEANDRAIYVGGIIGRVRGGNTNITNVYTMGNLYAANDNGGNYTPADSGLGAIYGYNEGIDATRPTLQGANYIKPQYSNLFKDLSGQANKDIDYGDRYNAKAYVGFEFTTQKDGDVYGEDSTTTAFDDTWRIYEGTTPILNAFLPNVEDYFSGESGYENTMAGIDSIQYGTAYDPLLTIINAQNNVGNLNYDWGELGISGAASLVVNNAGLTINNVDTSAGTGYYAGLLYSQGDLTLNAQGNEVSGDIGFGSEAKLYGSSVKINADGTVTIYGSVTATGEQENSTGNITINAGDVDVYGTLTTGQNTSIAGIANSGSGFEGETNFGNLSNPNKAMVHISDRFAHETTAKGSEENIIITAGTKLDANGTVVKDENGNPVTIGDGNVNLYFGNKENGITTTGGDLTVTATGDVYVDSDLDIGGDLTLKGTGENSEVVLDLTNIGQVQADNGTTTDALTGLHDFMHHFGKGENDGKHSINLSAEKSGDAKLAVDMWNGDTLDLDKYDKDGHKFVKELNNLKATINGEALGEKNHTSEHTYIWVSNAEQLKNIQNASKDALGYNFALKNDINASDIENYVAIGTDSANGFTGTFDGRGNRIIGLTVKNNNPDNGNAGIFSTIGKDGVVKNLNIYSGNFTSTSQKGNAGTVAGENNGRIENITAFGNTVTASGNAGGIVGVNNGSSNFENSGEGASTLTGNGIYDVESTGSVIAGNQAVAGGLVGINNGALGNSYSNSAVTANDGTGKGLGGVVGVNNGEVQYVDSLGVTNGGSHFSDIVGGIIGSNNGKLYSAYNESIVSGLNQVGGIIGDNTKDGKAENLVNATSVTGVNVEGMSGSMYESSNIGGLVGTNSGSVTNGRNNGTITGTNYVGGMVGTNEAGATLENLVNDSSASITGVEYVGGIAGSNAGTIITGNEEAGNANLINRGSITGYRYVGGVAGENKENGEIENANNDVELNVNIAAGSDAQFFGGIAGINNGTINNATNTANVNADGATYVGGIVGQNNGTLQNMAGNSGNVTGKGFVGGVVGQNNKVIDRVEASNDGTVKATDGGAGGIFAENTGNITNSTLTNNKVVIGTGSGATGGLIGKNSGDISHSSLINSADGQVIGTNNVGGLIGINTGTIEGGRTDADGTDVGYYKYQIYNNGVINVGTWTDTDNDNVVDEGEVRLGGNGSNIGGLIGNNTVENGKTGSLTAGYNTGAINAEGSTNVGGIAGSNSGTIDQVFNTVMTDGKGDAINGGTNIGGLVGNNAGTLTNAYNTTDVSGAVGPTGNAVGTNSGTVQYVYGTGKLIGNNTAIDKVSSAYDISKDSATWLQSEDYEGFNFGADGEWMIYGGSTNPLLSVFLTKVTVVDQHKVNEYFSAKHYGEFQQITAEDINALIALGAISAPDADGFDAFKNANGLISGVAGDLGAYTNWLYSGQIASSGSGTAFNPNNLGYDISLIYSPFEADMEQSSRWDYLFSDNPFDRNRNFRERKAEVNFVGGGMEI